MLPGLKCNQAMTSALQPSALMNEWLRATSVGTIRAVLCLQLRILAHETEREDTCNVMTEEQVCTTRDLPLVKVVHPQIRSTVKADRRAADAIELTRGLGREFLGHRGLYREHHQE